MNHIPSPWQPESKPDEALTLPSECYVSGEILATEKERIFYRTWQLIGHASQIEGPGDYFTCRVIDENILVIRSTDGVIRAFYNVCVHRAHELLQGEGRGKLTIVCPYHAWTYDTDGRLRNARNSEHVASFDGCSFRLRPVQVEEFCSFLFVNLDPDAPSLKSQTGDLEGDIRHQVPRVDELRLRHRVTKQIKANWKVNVENFAECYHCAIVHKALMGDVLEMDSYEVSTFGIHQTYGTRTKDHAAATAPTGAQVGRAYRAWLLFPHTAFQVYPGHMTVFRWIPIDPDTTTFIEDWYLLTETPTEENWEAINFRGKYTQPEDDIIVESVQRGLHSRSYDRGLLMVDGRRTGISEHGVQHFQALVREAMQRADEPRRQAVTA